METFFALDWPFVRGNHRSPVNSPHKGQSRRALVFSLICVWIKGWVNNREVGDLRCHCAHYDVIVMGYNRISFVPVDRADARHPDQHVLDHSTILSGRWLAPISPQSVRIWGVHHLQTGHVSEPILSQHAFLALRHNDRGGMPLLCSGPADWNEGHVQAKVGFCLRVNNLR